MVNEKLRDNHWHTAHITEVSVSCFLVLITLHQAFCSRLQKRGVKFYHRKIESFKEVSENKHFFFQIVLTCPHQHMFLIIFVLPYHACLSLASRERGRCDSKLYWSEIRGAPARS